jgi:hypothetical protein
MFHQPSPVEGSITVSLPAPRQHDRANYSCHSPTLAIHPEPAPPSAEEDESHGAGPERYTVAARHLHPEEDVKQLRKGDEPYHDRSDKRRRLPHLVHAQR